MEWPKTVAGWLGVMIAVLVVSGAGSVAGLYRWAIQPLIKRLAEEAKERKRAIDDEARERRHDFERLDNPETGRITIHRTALKRDIDAVGEKVNNIEKDIASRESRTRALEDAMKDSERDRREIHRILGEMNARVTSLDEKLADIQVNIINAVQTAKSETLNAVAEYAKEMHALSREVAVIAALHDRERRKE